MVRNVSKEDLGVLSKLLGKTFKDEEVDFTLSMLDEVDEEIHSVFLVGVDRVAYEIGGEDDDADEFYCHEVLGIYTKYDDESLSHSYNEVCATAHSWHMTMFWMTWTEEKAKLLAPALIEDFENNTRYLYDITYGNVESKYKDNGEGKEKSTI